jgi:hypothetical protein
MLSVNFDDNWTVEARATFLRIIDEELRADGVRSARLVRPDGWDFLSMEPAIYLAAVDAIELSAPINPVAFALRLFGVVPETTVLAPHSVSFGDGPSLRIQESHASKTMCVSRHH